MNNLSVEDFNERSLVSSIVYSDNLDIDLLTTILNFVPSKMFSNILNRKIIEIINNIKEVDGEDIIGTKYFSTKIGILARLEMKNLDSYVVELSEQYNPIQTWKYWAKKIQDSYFKRRFTSASSKEEFEDIIAEQQSLSIETDMCSIADNANELLDSYEQQKGTAIFTNYPSLNAVVGSLQGGDMVVLAGATGGGKTCFMLNLVVGIAQQGKKVDVFSLEMPKSQLQQRIICSQAGIDSKKFRAFALTDEDKRKYFEYANNEFCKLPINIYRKQTVSMETIRNIEMKSDSDIVFIDYLGLINSYNNKGTYDKFSEISRQIKLLAMQCNKPIIALHQLNRSFQDREDKTPKTSDLRDSGKIEQDSDMIWFVYRPSQFDKNADKTLMKFLIAKNRHGESNQEVEFIFDGKNQRISERMKLEM